MPEQSGWIYPISCISHHQFALKPFYSAQHFVKGLKSMIFASPQKSGHIMMHQHLKRQD